MAEIQNRKNSSNLSFYLGKTLTLTIVVLLLIRSGHAKPILKVKTYAPQNPVGIASTSHFYPNLINSEDEYERNSKSDRVDEQIMKSLGSHRPKRSPYPPGYVTWGWTTEPCICPPGLATCRCFSRSKSVKSLNQTGSNSTGKTKKRVTRSKKNKL